MNTIVADTGKILEAMKIVVVLYVPFLIKTLKLIFVTTTRNKV
jgi:hypothetical protein